MKPEPKKVLLEQKDAGFSLIELAIALIVIGLLAGALLKGRELIESARLSSLLSQVREYQLAVSSFHLKYGALPGDFDQAKALIDQSLENGDGNGQISGEGSNGESLHFWAHLAKGDFISSSTGTPPPSKLGGSFTVVFKDGKHWFVLGEKNGHKGDGPLLTPQQAMNLGKKLGFSEPNSGSFRVENGHGVSGDGACVTGENAYNLANKNKACVVYFQFQL